MHIKTRILIAILVAISTPTLAETDSKLSKILSSQPEQVQARYQYRNPQATLEFFGIKPGMTVVEALPGGGWYSKILLPYLGKNGQLYGVDYAVDLYPLFGFFSDEQLKAKQTWAETWLAEANGWRSETDATLSAFTFATVPEDKYGSADAVLFIRAMHNLARFESQRPFLTEALQASHKLLKKGGIVGVVQHQMAEDKPDAWADGTRGYLKQSFLVETFQAAGFELVRTSDVNKNPQDNPVDKQIVWRLPPTYFGSRDDADMKKAMDKIGESNRMTLLFRKK